MPRLIQSLRYLSTFPNSEVPGPKSPRKIIFRKQDKIAQLTTEQELMIFIAKILQHLEVLIYNLLLLHCVLHLLNQEE